MSADKMTKADIDRIERTLRQRQKVGEDHIKARRLAIIADGEMQLAARYSAEDLNIRELVTDLNARVEAVNAEIAVRAKAMGIPKQFAPSVGAYYDWRGENASKDRRAEYRRVLHAQADERAATATAELHRRTLIAQEKLVFGTLDTAEAAAFFESMPTVDELLPAFSDDDIQAITSGTVRQRNGRTFLSSGGAS
jgi:hypothetical protein